MECYGHDINLTQRELRYTAIPDLREEYHPGEELECVVTGFDPEKDDLQISVKATQSNPFDGAEQRHPVGEPPVRHHRREVRRRGVLQSARRHGVYVQLLLPA